MSSRALDVGREGGSDRMTGRKGRQPVSFSGPFNSTGTTPSTHTPGDVMSMSALPRSGSSSKPVMTFGVDITSTLTSPSNQLWNDKDLVQADMDVCQGFKFTEVNYVRASTGKVVCCHFSSDGKLLASGGHDKKAVLWYADTLKPKASLEEHSFVIADVRFSPSMARLATSSFDKTVKLWDADNPGYSLRTFTGHSAGVTSLDFHPNKEDLICSCAVDGEIRYWSIINGNCARVFKGGTTQVRFQPHLGRYLAAAAENVVSILDAETQTCQHLLKSLELWNTTENKIIATIPAHDGLISSLAATPEVGLVASVSHDKVVKLWK